MNELFLDIIKRIKDIKGLDTDTKVAEALDMTKNNLYAFKGRPSLPLKQIHTFCSREGVRLEYIINGTLPIYGSEPGPMPKIPGYGTGIYIGESQSPYTQTVKISDPLIQKTAAILESPTIFSHALKSNIEAFHHALTCEQKLAIAMQKIEELEEWKKSVEKRLPAIVNGL
jgi:hypothetical protein